ncbi:acyl carrier protein [Nocardia sp. NPDC050175]|uniref:acyl carrier protein n=1 Tax=Nocardia sp. NPDC050175 TaxID=3364317 RepID=UPI0037B033DB
MVSEQLGVSVEKTISEASFVNDLGADDVSVAALMTALGEEFGIEIPDEVAPKITSVQRAIEYVRTHSS